MMKGIEGSVTARLTNEEVERRLEKHGFKMLDGEVYKNGSTPINIVDEEGYRFHGIVQNISKGQIPNRFHTSNPFSFENMKLWMIKNAPEYTMDAMTFTGHDQIVKFTHKTRKDLKPFYKGWSMFTRTPRHPDIGYEINTEKRRHPPEHVRKTFDELLRQRNNGYWKLVEGEEFLYKNDSTKLTLKSVDGYLTEYSYNNLTQKDSEIMTYFKGNQETTIHNMRLFLSRNFEGKISLDGQQSYIGAHDHYKFFCLIHGKFQTSWKTIRNSKYGCHECYKDTMQGETHPNWNPNLTDGDREEVRTVEGYDEWRRKVFERDGYTCQLCGDNSGGNLTSHHKDGYNWCKERRVDVNNGVTLCETCHRCYHSMLGVTHNTEDDYQLWLHNMKVLKLHSTSLFNEVSQKRAYRFRLKKGER